MIGRWHNVASRSGIVIVESDSAEALGMVRGHVEAADRDELSKKKSELKDIEASREDLESQFTQNLGFLRRGVLTAI